MSSEKASKRMRVNNCFSYHEEKVSDNEVNFGWVELPEEDLALPAVFSYGSKSKKVSDEDAAWSKEAGSNAASLEDYNKYFKSLTGDDPAVFLEKWIEDIDSLEAIRRSANPKYREGEGSFLVSLSNLLVNGKRFTQYGRVFKLIEG